MKQKRKQAIETGRKMFVQHLRALDGVWDERYDQNALSLYVEVSKTSINRISFQVTFAPLLFQMSMNAWSITVAALISAKT